MLEVVRNFAQIYRATHTPNPGPDCPQLQPLKSDFLNSRSQKLPPRMFWIDPLKVVVQGFGILSLYALRFTLLRAEF